MITISLVMIMIISTMRSTMAFMISIQKKSSDLRHKTTTTRLAFSTNSQYRNWVKKHKQSLFFQKRDYNYISSHFKRVIINSEHGNENENEENPADVKEEEGNSVSSNPFPSRYDLGLGKNMPFDQKDDIASITTINGGNAESIKNPKSIIKEKDLESVSKNWIVPNPVVKPPPSPPPPTLEKPTKSRNEKSTKRDFNPIIAVDGEEDDSNLRAALWHEDHYEDSTTANDDYNTPTSSSSSSLPLSINTQKKNSNHITKEELKSTPRYEDIDLSIPSTVYTEGLVDTVWDLMRYEALREAEREPLLVSFLYSTILNHPNLESSLAFHLANRLSSPAMISTQTMAIIREALDESPIFRRSLRADILAVRDRDPACTCLPDVFLYFKGFHALQTHRAAHHLWKTGRQVLSHYLQSQVSQNFQIDIHPNATMGSGIMLDHGTGIVIGETATVGHNCSILHHVTLGGSGKKGVDRHPKVGNGVLLGAGASVLGNIRVGDGCQVGAGTLVIGDLPPHSVAVGVPAKIIGSFADVASQPSIGMNQLGSKEADANIVTFETDGI